MRIALGLAAVAGLTGASAQAADYYGRFQVRVTGGSVFRQAPDGRTNTTDLTGKVFKLLWTTSTAYNVPSRFDPANIAAEITTNAVSVGPASSKTAEDPFGYWGSEARFAEYAGDELSGFLNVGIGANSGIDSQIQFSFASVGGQAIGRGFASEYDGNGNSYAVGFAYDIIGGQAFASVPEPASWALLIGGVGAVGIAVRRRRRADAPPAVA